MSKSYNLLYIIFIICSSPILVGQNNDSLLSNNNLFDSIIHSEHNIVPTALNKSKTSRDKTMFGKSVSPNNFYLLDNISQQPNVAADPVVQYMNKPQLEKLLEETQKRMKDAAKQEDFLEAARLRDEMMELGKIIKEL